MYPYFCTADRIQREIWSEIDTLVAYAPYTFPSIHDLLVFRAEKGWKMTGKGFKKATNGLCLNRFPAVCNLLHPFLVQKSAVAIALRRTLSLIVSLANLA